MKIRQKFVGDSMAHSELIMFMLYPNKMKNVRCCYVLRECYDETEIYSRWKVTHIRSSKVSFLFISGNIHDVTYIATSCVDLHFLVSPCVGTICIYIYIYVM